MFGYQFKMTARQFLSMMPPVLNRKPRVFRAIELRANLLEIEVSEVYGISNEIKFIGVQYYFINIVLSVKLNKKIEIS
jgi:hypothetical protein